MKIYKILMLILVVTAQMLAQGGGSEAFSDVRSVAMGKTYTVSSRGVNTFGINPANLAFKQDHRFEIKTVLPLPNFAVSAGNDFVTMDDFNYFFGGVVDPETGETVGRDVSDPAEKQKLRDLFSDGSGLYTDVTLPIFAASFYVNDKVGAFGFSVSDKFGMWADLPTDLIDLYIDGTEAGRMYNLDEFDFEMMYVREYAFSYARELTKDLNLKKFVKQLNVGVSLKFVQGFAYAGLEQFNTTTQVDENDYALTVNSDILMNAAFAPEFGVKYDFEDEDVEKESDASAFPTPAGSGIGFDLGFSAQINKALFVGLAITDIGSMTWDEQAVEYSSPYSQYTLTGITDSAEIDTLKDVFKGEGEFVSSFETDMPTTLRIGAGFHFHERFNWKMPLSAYLDINQGFNDLPGNSSSTRVSLGFESKPLSWLPIRTGFSFGGRYGFNWAFGFGFDANVLEFDFSTTSLNSLFLGNSAKKIGVAVGSRWKF